MDPAVGQAGAAVKALLALGILASALHFATDRLLGALTPGYNFVSQSMSELIAAGAPTRTLGVTLELIAGLMMVAFSVGVWLSAGSTGVRVLAGALMASTVIGMIATAFFPMYPAEPTSTTANMTNVVLMAVSTVVLWSVAIVAAAIVFSGWFRWVSIATIVAWLLLTAWGLLGPRLVPAAFRVTTIGVQERTMGGMFLLWVALLAVYLLQSAET
jgi:hypothetical protein